MYVAKELKASSRLAPEAGMLPEAELAHVAGALLRLHGAMVKKLGADLVADPTLLMLLELFVARVNSLPMPVKVLAIGSGVPQSTALRWIDRLEAEGLIRKQINTADRRSALVSITDRALEIVRPILAKLTCEVDERELHAALPPVATIGVK